MSIHDNSPDSNSKTDEELEEFGWSGSNAIPGADHFPDLCAHNELNEDGPFSDILFSPDEDEAVILWDGQTVDVGENR